jgi:hypothetical protein
LRNRRTLRLRNGRHGPGHQVAEACSEGGHFASGSVRT